MRSVNKVILIGNLTRDPEMRQTPNGQSVVTFGLATNREWVTKDGRKQDSTEYHDLVAWAKLADICHQYLNKGKLVYVEGYLKTRSWDTPEGIKKFRTEVVVQDMIMLDKRGAEETSDYYPADTSSEETETAQAGDEQPEEKMEAQPQAEANAPQEEVAPPQEQPAEKKEPAAVASSQSKLDIDSDLGL